jgi:hypothetical protein
METKIFGKGGAADATTIADIIDKHENDVEDKAFLKEGRDLSGNTNNGRPAPLPVDPKTEDFIFMQIDTDYYTSIPPGKQRPFLTRL